ncbi:MAG: OmpA family protein [Leptospiraceae bacterium]|nr:OmpA family protein [Leptospiraceae bacterium]
MKKIFILSVILGLALSISAEQDAPIPENTSVFEETKDKVFRWKFEPGDVLELRKVGDQTVKFQGSSIKRKVYHRVLLENTEVSPKKGFLLEGSFSTSIKPNEKRIPYEETEFHKGSFYLNPRGVYEVFPDSFMPNIRSVPSFPEGVDPAGSGANKMLPGYRWKMSGEEAMKDRLIIKIPFEVQYEYRGIEAFRTEGVNRQFHRFTSSYQINYESEDTLQRELPVRMFGYVNANWLWDAEAGIPYVATEEYNVILVYAGGENREFTIRTTSFYRKIKPMNTTERKSTVANLKESLQGDESIKVTEEERGITIEIPDILFSVNSSELNSRSRDIIEKIADGLPAKFSRTLLIRGHTDSTGREEFNKSLSLERAKSVATVLMEKAELNPELISYEGRGSAEPADSNQTAEGRARNRRVEIVILYK